jgi:hypothetical protein
MIDKNTGIAILEIPPELQAEFDAWELASDEDFTEFEKMMLFQGC